MPPSAEAERVEPPALQPLALAERDARGVESEVDAAVGERPDREHREKPRASAEGGEIGLIGERKAQTGDEAAHRGARIAIGGSEAAEERRRSVGAADDGHAERKEQRAEERRPR